MKIGIVSSFDYYDNRIKFVFNFFKDKYGDNAEIDIYMSDFNHIEKKKILNKRENIKYISAFKYKKNISLKRLFSHYFWSKKVSKEINKKKYDIIYVLIPPNTLVKKILKNKKNVKVIIDIIDLWPESLTRSTRFISFFLDKWRKLRDNFLKNADYIFLECELYKEKLNLDVINKNSSVLYLTGGDSVLDKNDRRYKNSKLIIGYLGSINNIIDLDFIEVLLSNLKEKIMFDIEIIGKGEKTNEFISILKKLDIHFIYHGAIFDQKIKKEIMIKWNLGLNIMKKSVAVGLTTKSMDYLKYGIPILNNIKGDTWDLVEENSIGYNLEEDNLKIVSKKISLETNDIRKNRINKIYYVYEENFSSKAINKALFNGLNEVLLEE